MRLIILLGLLLGVLYSLHILVKDFQSITSGKLLMKFLFKRDVSSQSSNRYHTVRWKKILLHDTIQCARYLYCDLGANTDNEIRRGFALMLTLEPLEEDKSSLQVFQQAYELGRTSGVKSCRNEYPVCPFDGRFLFQVIAYLLKT
ncbi:uncharacterized protein LOC128201524 isoform X2 [Galleria mellonella]|uniref:Uncharacterized protein LOC128201524 isoform X2 n=1 Tax=Galleria mellonella TaxID=7137 RepID=A0ABM3MTM4_GALME|nr:uncharacterized protein LOC128201524 isoform X2 [Galleria mellonella]